MAGVNPKKRHVSDKSIMSDGSFCGAEAVSSNTFTAESNLLFSAIIFGKSSNLYSWKPIKKPSNIDKIKLLRAKIKVAIPAEKWRISAKFTPGANVSYYAGKREFIFSIYGNMSKLGFFAGTSLLRADVIDF